MSTATTIPPSVEPVTAEPQSRRALPVAGGAASSPPPALPLAHFAFALGWLAVAAVMLPWLAPRLVAGELFRPGVVALVHVLVLGVVGSAIGGALQQFVPGALGVPLRSVRIGWAGLWLHQAGVVVLVSGMASWTGWLQGAGWMLVFGGVGCVSANVLRARRRSVHGRQVGLFITVGHSALGVGMAIGAARIGETLGWWHLDRMTLLAAHAMLGAVGFGTLTAMGVGSRMIPTFLGAVGNDRRWLDGILALITSGLVVFTIGAVGGWGWGTHIGGALILLGGAACVGLSLRWFRRRTRPMDETAWHVAVAFGAIVCALPLGAALLVGDGYALTRWAALLVALLPGWLVTLTVGVQSKIASHLGIPLVRRWLGDDLAPTPPELRATRALLMSLVMLTGGWIALIAALLLGSVALARAGAAVWSLGAVVAAASPMWTLVRARRRARAPNATPRLQTRATARAGSLR